MKQNHLFPADIKFDHRFITELPGDQIAENYTRQVNACWSSVMPTPVSNPTLIAYSPNVAALLGLSTNEEDLKHLAPVFSGNNLLPGMQPFAACYGGHQFGNWAGQLGDGRAISLGELINLEGKRWEIQLKGAGPTPYSRNADGRAVLRSSLREFLCSEAMHYLGVPTTRALCLVQTGDQVMRDMFYSGDPKNEPGAIVTRIAPSFIRFGNFEILAARGEKTLLDKLINFTIDRDFPELEGETNRKRRVWFKTVCERTANLVIHWLRVGFVHGVMNTDNMSILGLTIDYGPYGWLDNYDPDWTPNTTDAHTHRYAYGAQADVAYWNLRCLAKALSLVMPIEDLQEGLDHFEVIFTKNYRKMIHAKFGFKVTTGDEGFLLAKKAFELMRESNVDMTLFFRHLADIDVSAPNIEDLSPVFYVESLKLKFTSQWQEWLSDYAQYCGQHAVPDRKIFMNTVNPLYVLRNYLSQEAIDLAHQGDYARIHILLEVIKNPYTANKDFEHFAKKRPEWALDRPGCSALSCSS